MSCLLSIRIAKRYTEMDAQWTLQDLFRHGMQRTLKGGCIMDIIDASKIKRLPPTLTQEQVECELVIIVEKDTSIQIATEEKTS